MALNQWLPRCVRPSKKSRKISQRQSAQRTSTRMLRVESLEGRIVPTIINVPGPFGPTIQAAINGATAGDTINVAAGVYQENLNVTKALTLNGANAGIAGAGVRGAETEILTNGNQNSIVAINAANVTLNGFMLEGNDPAVVGIPLASGADTNVAYGIRPTTSALNVNVRNNIVQDVAVGFRGDGLSTGNIITANWFNSVGNYDFGYAVSLRTGFYADVTNNKMTEVWTGIHTNDFHTTGGPATWTMSGNDIHSYAGGLLYWLEYGIATPLTFTNNTITAETGAVSNNYGILIVTVQDTLNPTFTGNTITGTDYGIGLTNNSTSNIITFNGTNSITGTKKAGVYLTDNLTPDPSAARSSILPDTTRRSLLISPASTSPVRWEPACWCRPTVLPPLTLFQQ